MYIIIITIIIKKGRQCKAGREPLTPYQSEDPSHTIPLTHRMKEEKGKAVGDKKGVNIGPPLETRQSHTIKYGVTTIVQQRYCQKINIFF